MREGGGVMPDPLTPTYFPVDPRIFHERRRNLYSPPRCFLHTLTHLSAKRVNVEEVA
jgi:hypothetical protein